MIPSGLTRFRRPVFQAALAAGDALWVSAVFGAALAARRTLPAAIWLDPAAEAAPSPFRLLLLTVLFVSVYAGMGLYEIRRAWAVPHLGVSLVLASGTATSLFVAGCYAVGDHSLSRLVLMELWGAAATGGILLRLLARGIVRGCARRGIGLKRIVIVGDDALADGLRERIESDPLAGLELVGQAVPRELPPGAGVAVSRASLDDLASGLLALRPHRVLFTSDIAANEDLQRLAERCLSHDVEVLQIPRLNLSYPGQVRVGELVGVPLLGLGHRETAGWEALVKATLDRALALALLVPAGPVLVATALWIRLTTGGPALERIRRAGRGGVPFTLLRLRTSVDSGGRPLRTPVGAFLLESGLDRMPQLLNVAAGSMSLVGPRPDEAEGTRRLGGWQRARLSVKPGLTGLSSLRGAAPAAPLEDLRLDLQYVETQSLLLDARILTLAALRLPARLGRAGRAAIRARAAPRRAPSGEVGGPLRLPTRGAP